MTNIWDYPGEPPEEQEIPERDEDEIYQNRKDEEWLREWEKSQESEPAE